MTSSYQLWKKRKKKKGKPENGAETTGAARPPSFPPFSS